jgi:hypothetical protein
MNRKPMFLLEILIAMSLVSLCIAPLMKGPIQRHKAEMEHLRRIESSRIAAWTFTEIVEKLLKNEIRWDALPKFGDADMKFPLKPMKLKLPPLPKQTLTRQVEIHTKKEKKEKDGRIHRLLSIRLSIGGRQFTYSHIVTKVPPPSV